MVFSFKKWLMDPIYMYLFWTASSYTFKAFWNTSKFFKFSQTAPFKKSSAPVFKNEKKKFRNGQFRKSIPIQDKKKIFKIDNSEIVHSEVV